MLHADTHKDLPLSSAIPCLTETGQCILDLLPDPILSSLCWQVSFIGRYAVLDECTSAVSADGEENLYRRLQKSGITLLSIAHRPALKKYHSAILYLDGSQGGSGWRYEKLTTDATNPQWMFWSLKSLTLQMLASIRNFFPASLACSQDSSQIPQVLIVDSLHGWIFFICAKKAKERLQ
jgi:hypothetical protein